MPFLRRSGDTGASARGPGTFSLWRMPHALLPRTTLTLLMCASGLALIRLLDLALTDRGWPIAMAAVLDEPAHLMTAGILMAALLPSRARRAVPWALAGAVLIDLDHVPLYLWGSLMAADSGRPVTHSLATIVALSAAALVSRRRARTALLGLALGVGLHLVRDLGTGPGVPLWWPIESHRVLVPYLAYFATLIAGALVAVGRRTWRRPDLSRAGPTSGGTGLEEHDGALVGARRAPIRRKRRTLTTDRAGAVDPLHQEGTEHA